VNGPGTFDSAWRAAALYLALALATTWPLALRLGSSFPADLLDPLLNAFILDWDLTHLSALAGGDLAAFRDFWNAPMFHPEPLTLAYSEHLLASAAMVWPVHALGGNVVLCYNVLFLATFVLSAVGMYLFARELTGSGTAAFVAGLLYGFALYRVAQFPHVQTLSSQWLPFALYGLRRFFVTRRLTPLAGATLALIAQNLSNGYYLLFFSPLVAAYCVAEILDRRQWRDVRVLCGVAGAAVATAAATLPILVPYLALRSLGFRERAVQEVQLFSADALAWLTAAPTLRLWGWLRTVPKPEGELFPGLVTIALASLAAFPYLARLWRSTPADLRRARRVAAATFWLAAAVTMSFTLLVEATGDPHWRLLGVRVTMRDAIRGYALAFGLAAVAFALSTRLRAALKGQPGSPIGFFVAAAVVTAVLALGPRLEIAGAATGIPLPYSVLYYHVPGFDGLRVPARFGMATMACLAVLAAFGAKALIDRGLSGRRLLTALGVLFVVESTSAPIALDERAIATRTLAAGPAQVYTGPQVPSVYTYLAALPAGTVVIEFPFGAPSWDLPALFYQRAHRHPLVNGYSGGFPRSFDENRDAFDHLDVIPGVAWQRLVRSGATHAVVHRHAFAGARAALVESWLDSHRAREIARFGSDVVFEIPR
jgi:hypothetical protein